MLGLALLYVGFVLIINGLWILGKLEARSVAPLNFFVGGLIVAGVLRTILTGTEQAQYFGAAQSLLFGFTYLMVALNNCCGLDGRALGWYCLLVSITAVPSGILALPDLGLFGLWVMWATLWFAFFLVLALGAERISRATGQWTIVNGIVTGVAAYFMLTDAWPW